MYECFIFVGIQVLICAYLLSQVSLGVPLSETGTYFLHVNKVYASYSSWLVMFTHELKPFGTNVRKVQNSIENFSNSFTQINKNPIPSNLPQQTKIKLQNLRSELHSLFQSEYQHFQRSFTQVQNAFLNLRSVTTIKESVRNKRSIFPFIGTIASKLFGVATKGELKQVKKGLNGLKGSEKETLHLLKNSMSVVNKTNQNVQINRKIINQLLKATDSLDTKLKQLYETYVHKISLELDFTQTSVELHSLFHVINSALDSLTTIFTQLSSQINDLHMGILPYDLAPPKILRNILLQIQEQLPPTLMLPHPVTSNLDKYYKMLHAVLIPDKGKFHVLTSVPLAHTKDQYDVFRAVNVPVPLNNRKVIQYLPEYPYIAVTEDKSSYTYLTDIEASQCHHDNFDYCPLNSPSYDTDLNPSCIMSLFLKDSTMIKNNCKPKVTEATSAPVLKHIVNGKWLSSSVKPYNIEMSCDNKVDVIRVNKGIQVIDLKQGCNAYTSYFRLPPYFRQQTEHEIRKSFKVLLDDPIKWQNIETNFRPYQKLNRTLLNQIPDLIDIQPDLDQLKTDIETAMVKVERIEIKDDQSIMIYIALSIGSLSILISLVMIIVYYRKRFSKYILGYQSHKREKVKQNDKVKDIEEAVEMAPLKATAGQPIPDDSQQKEKDTTVFNFTGKTLNN